MTKVAEAKSDKPRKVRRGDGPQIAYDYIRGEILASRMPAGSRIEENLIVNRLGLSRTPVRQALMRLATEGLIEIHPNQGARVPPLEFEEVRGFFEAFEYLMRATSFLAAKYATVDNHEEIRFRHEAFDAAAESEDVVAMVVTNQAFHLAIAQAGRNKDLTRFMNDLLLRTLRLDSMWYQRQSPEDATRVFQRSSREHRELLAAITASDTTGAMAAASTHVTSFRNPFLRYLQSSDAAEFSPQP